MTSQAPQNSLTNPTSVIIANQTIPSEGPKAIPLGPFNFGTLATYRVDLKQFQQLGRISVIQGMYIDNAGNTSNLVVQCDQSGQSITAAPQTQGYYPILATQPFSFTVTSAGSVSTNNVIYAYNVPIAPCVWSAISSAAALLTQPVSDAILDAIVSGGKAKTLEYAFGDADTVHEVHMADKTVCVNVTTVATTTLLTGSPGFFINFIDISLSESATLAAAGDTTFSLVDSNGPTTIWQRTVSLNNTASTTQIGGLRSTQLASIVGMNWNSKGTASTLQFRQSVALATGTVNVTLGAGTTAEIT